MGSGISCTREQSVPPSSPKAKPQHRPASVSQSGAAAAPTSILPAPSAGMGATAGGKGAGAGASRPASAAPAAAVPSTTSKPLSTSGSRPGRRLPHIGGLAVSLAFLVDFAERNVKPWQPTWAVVDELVKPHTLQDTIRYADLPHMAAHVLPPNRSDYYFISHAWGRPFWEMVGLCAHYLRGAVAEDTYVWCDIFIINQHPGQQQADDLHQLRLAVGDAAATLVCTDAAGAPFERIWCLFEMWTTLTEAATSTAGESGAGGGGSGSDGGKGRSGLTNSSCGRSRSQAMVVLTTGLSATQRAKLYGQIDAATSRATVAADKERILADIAASPGGITAFNAAMRCALLLRPLDYEGELAGLATRGSADAPSSAASQPVVEEWDFALLDAWLALPPDQPHHRALALLGGPGTGKSTAAGAALARMATAGGIGGGGAVPAAAHFCRANDLQALDPLAAMRTLAYQLSLLFPQQLQSYYAFDLSKDGGNSGSSFALQAIAGIAASGGGDGQGGGDGNDPVAAAFGALLLRPLTLVWDAYEKAVQEAEEEAEGEGNEEGAGKTVSTAAPAPPLPPPPKPRLVILLDAVDEGDSGGSGGHENAMLLMLQEHFPRLPTFVRLMVTARPEPHICALLAHKFDPRVISPADLRPPQEACAAVLAARLARRPALTAALQGGNGGGGALPGGVKALATQLWEASKGWMLFLRLAEDILEAAATAPGAPPSPRSSRSAAAAALPPLAPVLAELQAAASAADASSLYPLYMRTVVAPTAAAAAPPPSGPAGARATVDHLTFLLEVLGAAREPLYLSQLQDLGLPPVATSTTPTTVTAAAALPLRLGSVVDVRAYKLHGIHRSLFEWLASGGADAMPALLSGCGPAAAATATTAATGGGLRRGHSALAAMSLRDVAAARASQTAAAGGAGGGGARGPRSPDPYSLQHAMAHVLQAAADKAAAGEEEGAVSLLRSLLLDFYFWRCVYQDGPAAGVALASLLRHEAAFATASATARAASGPGSGGAAAALAADAARWLQSYHGSLLQHPEAVLQSALALPVASPVRAAAMAALAIRAPPRPPSARPCSRSGAVPPQPASRPSSRPASASGAAVKASPPSSSSGAAPKAAPVTASSAAQKAAPSSSPSAAALKVVPSSPSSSSAAEKAKPLATAAPVVVAQLGGASWPAPFPLSNPPPEWDACLLTTESRGVTRGLVWVPEQGLLVTACDDRKVHLLSAITGAQVGLMDGHTDRVYCVALRPETKPAVGKSRPPAPAGPPLVASGSLDGRIALWDGGTRVQLQLLDPGDAKQPEPGDGGGGGGGPTVVSAGYSVVEDRPTGQSAAGSVDCMAFSPDGAWLAAGTSEGTITVWEMLNAAAGSDGATGDATARAVKAWVATEVHKQAVAGLAFLELTAGGGAGALPSLVLASCSEDGSIHFWDPRVGGRSGSDQPAPAVTVVAEPLRTFRVDGDAQVRYEATGEQPPQPRPVTAGSSDPWHIREPPPNGSSSAGKAPAPTAAAANGGASKHPSPQPPLLSGVAEDTEGPLSRSSYRAAEHHCLVAGPGLPPGCLLAGTGSGPVGVLDAATGLIRERLRGHRGAVQCLALQNGGPHFASGSADCTVRLWRHLPTADPQRWAVAIQAARKHAKEDAMAAEAARAAASAEEAAAEEAKRKEKAAEDKEGEEEEEEQKLPPRVCRRPCQWECVAVLRGHTRLVTSVEFLSSPAARSGSGPATSRLASASVDFTVRIWRTDPAVAPLQGGDCGGAATAAMPSNKDPPGHEGYSVNTVAVAPNGRLIATGADDFTACVWDGASGSHKRTLRGHYGQVKAVAFSRDSKHMATAAGDGDLRIFSCEDFSTVGWCKGHTKAATAVAFSPDGYSLVSASEDGTARVWSIRGFQTSMLEGHPSGATAVAWAEEGGLVATGAAKGDPGVQLWDTRMNMRINTFRYHVSDVAHLVFGSAAEPPPPPLPPPLANPRSRPTSAARTTGASPAPAAPPPPPPPETPRRRVLLLSVDVRGLACVWDAWGGGLLHYIENVQGADMAGSRLLWLQARAMHYADVHELLLPRPPEADAEGDGDGGGRRRQWVPRRLATAALAALYPPGEAVDVLAVGPELSCVAAVTDKQRLYVFRPQGAGLGGGSDDPARAR